MSNITKEFRTAALRKGLVIRSKRDATVKPVILNAAAVEFAHLGFRVDPNTLVGLDVKTLQDSLEAARVVIGADRAMKPVYAGFPKQVKELDTATLIIEQLLHYWTGGAFLPNHGDISREGLPLEDMARADRVLTVVTAGEAASAVLKDILANPVAVSDADRELLKGSVAILAPNAVDAAALAKNTVNGENLQVYVSAVAEVSNNTPAQVVEAFLPVATNLDQALRVILAVATFPVETAPLAKYERAVKNLSNKDASTVKFKSLPKSTRRLIVARLADLSRDYKADSLVARRDLWRRALRSVHPYDFNLSVAASRAVDIVHSNVEYRTFNSEVEAAMEKGDAATVVELLTAHQPGNLLRRVVAILRLSSTLKEAKILASSIKEVGHKSSLTTLISAYNGVINANDETPKLTKVAGRTNTIREVSEKKVNEKYISVVSTGLLAAIKTHLSEKAAPVGPVAIESEIAVPLVLRDAASSDRGLDRGEKMTVAGEGDTLRLFGHWNNDQNHSGYMDIGVVVLDGDFNVLATATWDSWPNARDWAVYSGDKLVQPGDNAAEYIDVDLKKLKKSLPNAAWVSMTVQSWSGWPINQVDFLGGAMLRSSAEKGWVFEPRSVVSAFKPTTVSTHSLPFAVKLEDNELVWLDSSNGSTRGGNSASRDTTTGILIKNEIAFARLTYGELAELWAEAHNVETVNEPVVKKDILSLLS